MDLFAARLKICFLMSLVLFVEGIVFEINDYDMNRIVFEMEKNIKMTCNASEFDNPVIVIEHNGANVERDGNNFVVKREPNSFELSISLVNLNHAGTYQCTVWSTQGFPTMGVSSLMLNVTGTSDGLQDCLQSGTSLTKTVGEYFTLYCYFVWFANTNNISSSSYTWNVTNGPVSSPLTSPSDIIPGSDKGVIKVNIGPLNLTNNGSIYSCGHPLSSLTGQQPCTIGPIIVEQGTTHLNIKSISTQQPPGQSTPIQQPPDQSTLTQQPGQSTRTQQPPGQSSLLGTIQINPSSSSKMYMASSDKQSNSMLDKTTTSSTGTMYKSPSSRSTDIPPIILIAAGTAITILIVIVSFHCLVICCTCRDKKGADERRRTVDYDLTRSPMYRPGDDENDDPATRQMPSDPESSPEASVYHPATTVRHFGRDGAQDGTSYDKVNHGMIGTSGDTSARGAKGGSHEYPPERGDSAGGSHNNFNAFSRGSPGKERHTYDDPPGVMAWEKESGDLRNTGEEGARVGRGVGNGSTGVEFSGLYAVVKKEYKARYARKEYADPELYCYD